MKRERKGEETTELVWEPVFEELMCRECHSILYWNFGFERCPYCHRKIVYVDQRRPKAEMRCGRGVIVR